MNSNNSRSIVRFPIYFITTFQAVSPQVCLLNRFSENLSSKHQFVGLDELGGAPYENLGVSGLAGSWVWQ